MNGPARGLPATDIAVVGPGRVGTVLAAALERAGHRVRAVVGGGSETRQAFLTRFPRADGTVSDCGLVVVATPDDAVEEVVTGLVIAGEVREEHRVVHVSGALGLAPLRRARLAGARVAACHPAQTVPHRDTDPSVLLGAAWAVTAHDPDRGWAHALVRDVGGVPIDVADSVRVLYHAGLTVGSNAVAAAVSVARRILLGAGISDPAVFLSPLVKASADNVLASGAEAITGPVRRGDAGTVRRHLEALSADLPDLGESYRDLSDAILAQVRPGLDESAARAVEAALRPDGEGA